MCGSIFLVNGLKETRLAMGIPQDKNILRSLGTLQGVMLLGWRKWQPAGDENLRNPIGASGRRVGGDQIRRFYLEGNKMKARVIPGNPQARLVW
jgi:hypothetical protein